MNGCALLVNLHEEKSVKPLAAAHCMVGWLVVAKPQLAVVISRY